MNHDPQLFILKIEKLEKAKEKLQLGRNKIQEALAKVQVHAVSCTLQDSLNVNVRVFLYNCIYFLQTTVLLDEAKIREDARHVQHKCLEKEHVALKEENKKVHQAVHSAHGCWFALH